MIKRWDIDEEMRKLRVEYGRPRLCNVTTQEAYDKRRQEIKDRLDHLTHMLVAHELMED